jgi:hypothetical protein
VCVCVGVCVCVQPFTGTAGSAAVDIAGSRTRLTDQLLK